MMYRSLALIIVMSPFFCLVAVGTGYSAGESVVPGGVPLGIVAGVAGQAAVHPAAGVTRQLRVGDRVGLVEEIRTEASGSAEILWERRALFVLGERSRLKVVDSKTGAVGVDIEEGTVRVSYSYNEGRPTDTLTIYTPAGRTVLRGGIVEVSVPPTLALGTPLAAATRTNGAASAGGTRSNEILRVIEGQVQVEGRAAGAKPTVVKTGQEIHFSERAGGVVRPSTVLGLPKLASVPDHQAVPDPTIRHMVHMHVEHALEVERALHAPSREESEAEGLAASTKGTIVATSLGIPLTTLSGSTAAPAAAAPVPGVSGPIPAPIVGGAQPGSVGVSQPGPVGSGPSGIVSPPAAGAAPIVPLPTVQPPVPPAVTPSQSGGINTRSLLRQVLREAVKDKGKHKGRGRERD